MLRQHGSGQVCEITSPVRPCQRRWRSSVLQPIHRWLTDLEQTACGQRRAYGLRRPLVVRGWQDVTCKRCLGSIHAKLEQLQRQQPGSQGEP